LADKAYSTAASFAAKSAYLAASASSADFLLFSAFDYSANCFFVFFFYSAYSVF